MFKYFEDLVDPFQEYNDKDTPPARLLPFLHSYLQAFYPVMALAFVFTALVGIGEILLIFYSSRIVDLLAITPPEQFFDTHKTELIWVVTALVILLPLFVIIDVMLLNQTLMPNLGTLVRWRSHRHVIRQSVGWFENDFAGRIANRIMQTAPATGEAAFQVFDAGAYAIIYLIGAVILLAQADLRLALPIVFWAAAYVVLLLWAIPRIGERSKAFSDARSTITGRIVDSYTNIQSVKLFAHSKIEEDYAREAIENGRRTFQQETRIVTIMDLGLTILNTILIVVVIGWSVLLWSHGDASVGTVTVACALTLRLNAMTGWIMWAMSSLFQNLGVISEGMGTIAQPILLTDADGATEMTISEGSIELQGINHHYGKEKGGLTDINLTIKGGEKIGIVGRSSAGKSSLVKMLLRFYDSEDGRILIDGQDISHVTQDSLRRQIGMVTQDSSLMHRSVRDNIRYGRDNVTEAQIVQAARHAEADTFIHDLEDLEGRTGYDAHVGERGVKLSGGQRQRIAIARVMLKDAPILVLDEATSALDSEVEAAIQETLYGMMRGKTVIAIAHRLSTIAQMDRIIVLDDGRIVEQGNHKTLIAEDGLYARFWSRQSGGFIGIEDSSE